MYDVLFTLLYGLLNLRRRWYSMSDYEQPGWRLLVSKVDAKYLPLAPHVKKHQPHK